MGLLNNSGSQRAPSKWGNVVLGGSKAEWRNPAPARTECQRLEPRKASSQGANLEGLAQVGWNVARSMTESQKVSEEWTILFSVV